ncbi:MAG: CCA tRNA nucleotidyltransferase, partial [Cucumibacter sp.]
MQAPETLAGAAWLKAPATRAVFKALDGKAGRTRAVGGIVRDTLLGIGRADIDMATEFKPKEVMARAEAAGLTAHPTGIAHGTITLVHQGNPIEVTTLRRDIETDGRRAVVRFGTDWADDAARRDFTMNAVYAFANGKLFDPLGGVEDCLARRVRFIGHPDDRIKEDYLRILRFFRFFAVYGDGRPDAEGLKACARLKAGLAQLSAERVWGELKKLLGAEDPSRALLWMRTAAVLGEVLPESEKWGIDSIHSLSATGHELGWPPDPLLRLMAIVPPRAERVASLAKRLKLAKAESKRLDTWAASELPPPGTNDEALMRLLYRGEPDGIADRLRLAIARARGAHAP